MDKELKGLEILKKKYTSDKVLDDIKEKYGRVVLDTYVANILNVEIKDYKIIGYGSLMNYDDAFRSFKDIIDFKPIRISGWQRVFNLGYSEKYLNVQQTRASGYMSAVEITIPYTDMLEFILREVAYDLIVIQKSKYMVVATNTSNNIGEPVLTYVSLCLQGIQEVGTISDVKNFLEETIVFNGGSLKDWLQGLNILDYLQRTNHVSR